MILLIFLGTPALRLMLKMCKPIGLETHSQLIVFVTGVTFWVFKATPGCGPQTPHNCEKDYRRTS
jgi:hypothetical protein